MSFTDQFNPAAALVGGLLTTAAQEYFGVQNPMLPLLGASAVGAVVSKAKNMFIQQKDILPGAMTLATVLNKVQSKIGVQFFTIIVKKQENIIFNKLQNYIMHKYVPILLRGSIGVTDNVNMAMRLDDSMFSIPIYDLFEQNRVVITIVNASEIHICSKILDVEGLKRYLKKIMTLRLGVTKIIVHQPVIEVVNPIKINCIKSGDNKTVVNWTSFPVRTNKNFSNTILTDEVHARLVDDLKNFAGSEDYYNKKGIPYKRGYLLYGLPGTGKTSIIKAMASFYGMDIYLINMGDVQTEKEMSLLFQGTRSADGYHMLVFEDIDRCPLFQNMDGYYGQLANNKSLMRTFLNELDGVIETPKRITLLTANDESVIMKVAALCRPGRIDQQIKLGYCDSKQLCGLYNHFSDCKEILEMEGELTQQVTPAQVVKYILQNTMITPDEFKNKIGIIAEIEVKERRLCESLNKPLYGRRKLRKLGRCPVDRQRRILNRRKRELKKLESDQAKYLDRHRAKTEQLRKSEIVLQKRIEVQKRKKAAERAKLLRQKEREKKRKVREVAKNRSVKRRKLN